MADIKFEIKENIGTLCNDSFIPGIKDSFFYLKRNLPSMANVSVIPAELRQQFFRA